MKRTNEFAVVPQSEEDEELLRRLLDASAALWNEINYERPKIATRFCVRTRPEVSSTSTELRRPGHRCMGNQ